MRVLVCGGRDYTDREELFGVLNELHNQNKITTVISGQARGADDLGEHWGYWHELIVELYPADWKKHGRSAGPIRNKQMLDEGKPELIVAFKGGRGTANMMKQAREAGVKVLDVNQRSIDEHKGYI